MMSTSKAALESCFSASVLCRLKRNRSNGSLLNPGRPFLSKQQEVYIMSAYLSCPPAAGPLEAFAVQFACFKRWPNARAFDAYLPGLLLPRERAKTLTALAGAEPLVQAQAAEVQRLQFFLSESTWDAQAINAKRLALLVGEAATAPSAAGVLVIDDTGDRKDGNATDHVARQYLGSVGKIDNGIVAVTTLWADEQCYYPLHAAPYTPAVRLADGQHDAAFHTKPHIALDLVEQAQAAGIPFCAIVADCFYGDNQALEKALLERRLPQGASAPWRTRARPGAGRGGPLFQRCGAVAAAECLAARHSPLSRQPHRALVGGRAHAVRLWAGQTSTRCVRHDRSALAAGPVHLVPHHQLVARAGTAGRDRALCADCATGLNKATNK
jgi:hypothetical protein